MMGGGFSVGVGLRLVGVVVFAAFALAAVLVVERGGDPAAIQAAAPRAATASGRLLLEATYPVTQWTVQVQGRDAAAAHHSPQRFEADVSGDPATIFIQAEAGDPTSRAPAALRWTLEGKSGVLWGEGSVAGTLSTAAAAAGPPAAGRER